MTRRRAAILAGLGLTLLAVAGIAYVTAMPVWFAMLFGWITGYVAAGLAVSAWFAD